MKQQQGEVLTIEKLKKIMDRETNTPTRHRNTATVPRRQRDVCADSVFRALVYLLDPILPSDGTRSDGRIASVVYLICLTTAGIVMNITAWLQNPVDSNVIGVTTDHIDGFLITCILPALIWIGYIFCKQKDRKTVDFINSSPPNSFQPLMAGAYVFGSGSSVMDILHIFYYLHCSNNLSSLFFSLFKALFILTQILFLRKFARATLHKSQNIRLVLFHILGTNVCIWFRALFSHAKLIFRSDDNVQGWCGASNVPMARVWGASEPYLYPFTMEYSLIAGGMLYNMWSGLRDLHPDPQDIYIYDEIHHDDDGNSEKSDGKFPDDSSGYLGSPQLSRSQSHISLYSRVSNQSVCRSCHHEITTEVDDVIDSYNPSSDPGFLLGILVATLLFISVALLWIDRDSQQALRLYYGCQISLHVLVLLCLWCILKALQSQRPFLHPYKSDDTLLIVAFAGVFLYAGLSFTAATTEVGADYGGVAGYSLAKSSLVILGAMLQVTTIVKARRYRPSRQPGVYSCDMVRQGALFLVTANFALWGQDSFFELRNLITTPVQMELFGEDVWRAITIFAYPLCIFFRFHSAACLFDVWNTFRR